MKFKEFYQHLYTEASLSGTRRGGGGQESNWEHYVVKNFNPQRELVAEKNDKLFTMDLSDVLADVKKGDMLKILETGLKDRGRSSYAKVHHITSGKIGYLNISSIRKPSGRGKKGGKKGVIPGGTQSKEFTPDKLKLENIQFTSGNQIVQTVVRAVNSTYGDSKYNDVRKYVFSCLEQVGRTTINESFSKSYSLNIDNKLTKSDIRILSKNFGEVLGAVYVISSSNNLNYVEFPSNISQGLYDFIAQRKNGITEYYSVKSHGGSSTSVANVNYVLDNFSENNVLFSRHKKEVDAIRHLMNNKRKGITTIQNIEKFYDEILPNKQRAIIDELGKMGSYKPQNLSQNELKKWFDTMRGEISVNDFVEGMSRLYKKVFSDISGSTRKASKKTLEGVYEGNTGDKTKHGYLLYPMGSYLTGYLNENGEYKNILNVILNYGSYIKQFDVDLYSDKLDIKISRFKNEEFRFSYNAGAGYPANRPIGFKKG